MAIDCVWHDHPLQPRSILTDGQIAHSSFIFLASNFPSNLFTPSTSSTPSLSSLIHLPIPTTTTPKSPTPIAKHLALASPTTAHFVPSLSTSTALLNTIISNSKSTTTILHFRSLREMGSRCFHAMFMVGQKRGTLLVDLEDGVQPFKKVQLGTPATRWISIYSSRSPMKQRLDQHAEKGKEDGLYISREWILEQWDKNYITSFAGASNGSALVLYEPLSHYYNITPK
ncbi:Casein kinase 1-like protein HD16 [Camellia lanceoleosa]|uniref:Casein kinase 1-like protein HD16 n=1 Tax=Camellia lanceoleosa TaxID=1840588 RepID=A0ACC0G621_9ERIC|nr:Casein kinase 1-like protein HD16 [Camellia lanceoleosa]